MRAIVITEREFDLSLDKLKDELTQALDDRTRGGSVFDKDSFSRLVTYHVEGFRRETKA